MCDGFDAAHVSSNEFLRELKIIISCHVIPYVSNIFHSISILFMDKGV